MNPIEREIYAAQSKLQNFFRGKGFSKDETEDLVQDVLLKVINSQNNIEGPNTVLSYVLRSAQNHLASYFRDKDRYKRRGTLEEFKFEPADPRTEDRSAEDALIQKEQQKALHECVEECLDSKKRLVYDMKMYLGLEESQIAANLKISQGTVKSRFFKAKQLIEKCVKEKFFRGNRHGR